MIDKEYILDCLDKYCYFEELTENTFYESIIQPLKDAGCFNEYKWSYNNGVTKGVLLFSGVDFVIKIPFFGSGEYEDEHWEGENGTWYGYYTFQEKFTHTPNNFQYFESKEYCEKFFGAPYTEDGWNYCDSECYISEQSIARELAKCFARTILLGFAKEYPIYTQERCQIYEDARSSRYEEEYKNRTDKDYESLKEARSRIDFYGCDDDWVLDFLNYWGEEVLRELGNFLFDYDINDLHCGNIGYRNGAPVLIDYSSFNH
jgi:hypothetical protein